MSLFRKSHQGPKNPDSLDEIEMILAEEEAKEERWLEEHGYERIAWGLTISFGFLLLGFIVKLVITH